MLAERNILLDPLLFKITPEKETAVLAVPETCLTYLSQMWPKYLPLATFAYYMFNTQNLGKYSPYELTFGRKPRPVLNLDSNPDIKVWGTFEEYYELLNKRITYLHDILLDFKSTGLAMINKDKTFFQYRGRDLVYISFHCSPVNCTQPPRK